ncbi:hypothetical protein COLO4_10435 [Corchorus olitorius]|uniref:Uncharacterized protein n=1 Tax=Corchorus olitorius TaxID=93759 RepID=A0A1R3K8I0_9ROSI|nr:hypothetical protein COLO4_10435 [Corchorus olitorius]
MANEKPRSSFSIFSFHVSFTHDKIYPSSKILRIQ